jgi:uncharacterized protein YecA (UPF0149 family)
MARTGSATGFTDKAFHKASIFKFNRPQPQWCGDSSQKTANLIKWKRPDFKPDWLTASFLCPHKARPLRWATSKGKKPVPVRGPRSSHELPPALCQLPVQRQISHMCATDGQFKSI